MYISTALVVIKQTTVDLQSTMQYIQKKRNKQALKNLSEVPKALKVGMVYAKQLNYSDPFKKKSGIVWKLSRMTEDWMQQRSIVMEQPIF